SRRRARRRADGRVDGRERGPHPAASARARGPQCGRRLRAAAPPSYAAALPAPVPRLGSRGRVPRRASRADRPRSRLGARRLAVPAAAAPRRPDRARAEAPVSSTLVFIPAWNEEENLAAVLEGRHDRLPDVDVLVVDDGSTDNTAAVAREHGAEVLSLGTNQGLRFGIAAGYRWALEHGYSFCGRVDADG